MCALSFQTSNMSTTNFASDVLQFNTLPCKDEVVVVGCICCPAHLSSASFKGKPRQNPRAKTWSESAVGTPKPQFLRRETRGRFRSMSAFALRTNLAIGCQLPSSHDQRMPAAELKRANTLCPTPKNRRPLGPCRCQEGPPKHFHESWLPRTWSS